MRKTLVLVWFLLPAAVIAWHYGPGQERLARDLASERLVQARAAASKDQWTEAAALYAEAATLLPEADHSARDRVVLAQACALVKSGEMVEGQEELRRLLSTLEGGQTADPALVTSTRHELATASYYAAWLMRLEGATSEEWKPEIERARQQFRLLAEKVDDDTDADAAKRNLEAAIRLERMDLGVLRAMPLPTKCPPCKNLSQRKRKQCQSRSKAEGKKKGKKDARKKVKKANQAGLHKRQGGGS